MSLTQSYSKNPCPYCGVFPSSHYPYQCFKNPKRKNWTINKRGKVAEKWTEAKRVWFTNNPPHEDGFYRCYLNISPLCPKVMTPRRTTLDHLKPRGSNPGLRFDQANLFPACQWCNTLKGSRSIKEALKLKQSTI